MRKKGTGTIRKDGYTVIKIDGHNKYEHQIIWGKHFGQKPEGYDVHHKNGDKSDNRIENLELIAHGDHRKNHSGSFLKDGRWFKKCRVCGEVKEVNEENWYLRKKKDGVGHGKCRVCNNNG